MHGYLRKKEELEQKLYKSYETRYSFPQWLITDIKAAYGKSLGMVLENLNRHPPLTVRVNTAKCPMDE